MKFCKECESRMIKQTYNNAITFQCICQLVVQGEPDDTLMAEGYIEINKDNLRHDVLIDNAPFDLAGNIVMKDCPQCKLNFLTMVIIGESQITIYKCSCGFQSTHDNYMRNYVG